MGFIYAGRIFDKRGISRLLRLNEYFHICRHYQNKTLELKTEKISAREVRQLFLDYFVKEKNHTYVHSSPVFLNNDPSLLFVNAGMNQFRSLLMNKTHTGHPLHGLKRVANSQKCIRLSGKHNDLADVGKDLHHHTFFEMLGNWSFGDYSKKEACEMAWELLTKIYGLNSENLYVTYFNGDSKLGVPPDEECKNIWLDIGIHPSHIFPFGTKDNFWEMGDVGPCGPCTEIHYDFLSSGSESAAQRINSGRSDLIEIWNLVFIQYNRLPDGMLKALSSLNVDTGMGFERLTAVIQGTMSNYNTDIFIPLFKAIEKNFKVQPYKGKTGCHDVDGLDTAYRILADHSRMFTVSIADGIFPDYNDAGSVLRKIIRRAAYTANRVMKTRPGILTSLVPYVAESLDFYPEIGKHVKEVIDIVNEEEKLFHQLVNKGRKVRNKMMSESTGNVFDGQKLWELHEIHGLEENVIQDLLLEVNILPDWESYKQVTKEKQQHRSSQFGEKSNSMLELLKILENESIPATNDIFKYRHYTDKNKFGVESITSSVLAIISDGKLSSEVQKGNHCIIVTDKTNFYSEAGGQVSDVGNIYGKDFSFQVENVTSSHGFVFHHGTVTGGTLKCEQVQMSVNEAHHLACAQNHTATHLLNAALRKLLPYTMQRSSYVGPKHLRLGFSARKILSTEQVKEIESFVKSCIEQNLKVKRLEMPFEALLDNPKAVVLRGEEYPEIVSVIAIESNRDDGELISLEPCCGTHVHNTADLLDFTVIPSKSFGGATKSLSAVTGMQVSTTRKNGEFLEKEIFQLKTEVEQTLQEINVPLDTISAHLKKVKSLTK
ncbi:alanine--tRNA ligase, cytoplasmic-like, partial [Stegodyphus dumicola]|uniref:alanine--tRNA ligase, cytoplasmic-like n=1 Tax=Stegodyphus dumicola TaxID=202533 RepID=UPI0015AF14FF